MNLLNKLTIKNLKLNKKRTTVTIIGIILSMALITAVITMYTSCIKSLINFEIHERGNYHVAYYDVSKDNIKDITNNRGVEDVFLTKNIGYAKIDSKNTYKPYAYIKAFDKGALDNLSLNLVSGRLPENDTEIVIPTHLKTNGRLELHIGDSITLDVGKRVSGNYELNQNNPYDSDDLENPEKIINTTSKTYKIVGIIERPAISVENYSSPGYTFITYMDDKDMKENTDVFVKYNKDGLKEHETVTANILEINPELFKKSLDGNLYPDQETNKIANELNKAKYQISINNYLIILETNPLKESTVQGLGIVVLIVALIIVVTSVFCIKNSFDISITEKTKQYGMLRSIGATKKQIRNNVFYEALILGLIGIPLGLLIGLFASFLLIIISNFFLRGMLLDRMTLTFKVSWIGIIMATILGAITIYFSALRSARRASKLSPIASIKNSGDIKIKSKQLKTPKIITKLFGVGGEISYKNQLRNKKKYRTTIISIMISSATFIALSSFMNIAFREIDNELAVSEYNISLNASNYSKETYDKLISTTTLDNISKYAIIKDGDVSFPNSYYNPEYLSWLASYDRDFGDVPCYLRVISINDTLYKKYLEELNLDYDFAKDKGILRDNVIKTVYDDTKPVSRQIRIFNLKKDDIFPITLDDDTISNMEVALVTDKIPFGLKEYEEPILIISEELYNKLFNYKSVKIVYESSNPDKLQDDIDTLLLGENYSLNNINEKVKVMRNLYILVGIFLYGFIIVISLIGITNIFNTITTNINLRKQEFAMLKSIGMTYKEFKNMITLESIFIGFKSLIIGIPVGLVLSYTIYYFLSSSVTSYKIPITSLIITILVVYLLVSIIMKYSTKRIEKQNIIETIRNENI